MSITVGGITFDHLHYDAEGDVLYLHVGEPAQAARFEESPEGHALRFNDRGELVGFTIVNAKALLDDEEPVAVTIPDRVTIDAATLARAVQSAA